MSYQLDKYGDEVREDLNKVEEKRVYPDASLSEKGVMTPDHLLRIGQMERDIEEESLSLSEEEIRMICMLNNGN